MAVNEQFPTLTPTLYPVSKATDPRTYALLDAMWRAFSDLAHNKTPAVNGEKHFSLPVSSTGSRSSAPSRPRPTVHGRGQGRVPSQSPSWQTGSSHNPIVMPIADSTDPGLDKKSNCWPLEEQHCAEVFAVSASFKTDNPPRFLLKCQREGGSSPDTPRPSPSRLWCLLTWVRSSLLCSIRAPCVPRP